MSEATPRGHVEYDASPAIVLSNQARAALESATDLVIDSPTMYELASDELRQIKALQKTVEEKAHRHHRPAQRCPQGRK